MKKAITLLLAMTLILSMLISCGGGGKEESQSVPSSLEPSEYNIMVKDCQNKIYDLTIILGNMGTYEVNYWKTLENINGTFDSANMVKKTYEWLERESEYTQKYIEDTYDEIKEKYSALIKIEVAETISMDLRSKIIEMYEAFYGLYSLVTSPSGTASSFASDILDNINTVKDTNNSLDLLSL